ncbi:hypothetical protein B0A49_12524, partial [Cryomyces minteri]
MSSARAGNDGEQAEAAAALAPGGVVKDSMTLAEDVVVRRVEAEKQSSEETLAQEAPTRSSRSSSPHIDDESPTQAPPRDPETRATVKTNTPPHSIFSKRQKQFVVFMVAWGGFFSPLSANIYFPALNTLATDLKVSNELINLTLTSYMIFQGLAPTVFGDLADMAGRRPAYVIGFVIYIGACIGIALQNSYAALFLLRCLQSTGSSGTIALGNGVVADIATASERGSYMGWATSGPMIGPAVGPVLGGILSQFLGWRSIFWFLVIMAIVYLVPFLITFPETGRNVVGNGSIPPQGWNMSLLNYLEVRRTAEAQDELSRTVSRESNRRAQQNLAQRRKLRWPNPLNTLHVIFEKDVGLLLFYNSLVYTAFYSVTATIPYLFAETYHFNDLQIGICFIPFGVGCFLAPVINGRLLDWNFRRVAKAAGISIDKKRSNELRNFPLEKARIQVAWPLVVVGDVAMLCYGWTMQYSTSIRSLAAPLVLQFILGVTFTGAFNVMSVMLVDFYPLSPSTATAANNLAVLNPDNGPDGGCSDPDYINATSILYYIPSIKTLAYVHTAARYNCGMSGTDQNWPMNECTTNNAKDIQIDDIFFGETLSVKANAIYMQRITSSAKPTLTRGNTVLLNAGSAVTDYKDFTATERKDAYAIMNRNHDAMAG